MAHTIRKPVKIIGNKRLSFIVPSITLLLMALTMELVFHHQQISQVAAIHAQGTSLVEAIARIPLDQLIAADGLNRIYRPGTLTQKESGLAYITITDAGGNSLASTHISHSPPPISAARNTTDAPAEHIIHNFVDGRDVIEFIAPIVDTGKRVAVLRLGYYKPGLTLNAIQTGFYAFLAFALMLMVSIPYFMVRLEFWPLARVTKQLQESLKNGKLEKLKVNARGKLSELIQTIYASVDMMEKRSASQESEKAELLTTLKIASYRRRRIETALQALPEAVIILDESGTIAYGNSKLQVLLGISNNNIIGSQPSSLFMNQEVLSYLASYAANTRRTLRSSSVTFVPNNAPEKRITISGYPLLSENDQKQTVATTLVDWKSFTGTFLPFSVRDTTSEILARNARNDFISHVAHELKSPLAVMHMYSEMLQDNSGGDQANVIEAANVIHDEVERLSILINNLLSINKIEMGSLSLDRQRVKLRDLLIDTFNSVSKNGKASDLVFNIDIPTDFSPLHADKNLLRIAINNLLTNAIKYNKPAGRVTLTAEETDREILIHVKDTGVGINPDEQERIFEKFYRSDNDEVRSRPGHGLGLALTKDIIQLHHGELLVNSVPGEGTVFTIRFEKELGMLKQAI